EHEAADRLDRAVEAVLREGRHVTYDFKSDRNDPTAVGTKEMAEAIADRMKTVKVRVP
ncbi:MAG: isocitrate/isopropylmalate dehydrogenase family protein, partial [Candidatus Omnitrophica bacterium]|nr:isocitrate/isopropylmalate dehydrogenase family protein [Candidatus Omnitrophota bacterium]MBI3022037.1 isocitrate/isopropylmalate dehydrogenase family protein [Candidatus Omnitrophota bacterium]